MVAEKTGPNPPGNQPESRVTESAARRRRVLAYPDLARRLTEPPLNFRRPEDWSGYIPPRTDPPLACEACRSDPGKRGCRNHHTLHVTQINNSPRRTALVELAAEALRREQAACAPDSRGPDGV